MRRLEVDIPLKDWGMDLLELPWNCWGARMFEVQVIAKTPCKNLRRARSSRGFAIFVAVSEIKTQSELTFFQIGHPNLYPEAGQTAEDRAGLSREPRSPRIQGTKMPIVSDSALNAGVAGFRPSTDIFVGSNIVPSEGRTPNIRMRCVSPTRQFASNELQETYVASSATSED